MIILLKRESFLSHAVGGQILLRITITDIYGTFTTDLALSKHFLWINSNLQNQL